MSLGPSAINRWDYAEFYYETRWVHIEVEKGMMMYLYKGDKGCFKVKYNFAKTKF